MAIVDRPVNFNGTQVTGADAVVATSPTMLANYSVANGSASPVTVNFCDDADYSLDHPIETVIVPAHSSYSASPNRLMMRGINVNVSNWLSVTVSVRYT